MIENKNKMENLKKSAILSIIKIENKTFVESYWGHRAEFENEKAAIDFILQCAIERCANKIDCSCFLV